MSLTEIINSLSYEPEQTGQLLKMVRDNFLQLNSFLQLPDERLEKMGIPIAVIYAVRDKARANANQLTPTSSSNTPASTPSTSMSTPVRRAVITPESILTSTPATLDELKKLTSKINPEVDSHKLKLASIVCAKMVEVGFERFFVFNLEGHKYDFHLRLLFSASVLSAPWNKAKH